MRGIIHLNSVFFSTYLLLLIIYLWWCITQLTPLEGILHLTLLWEFHMFPFMGFSHVLCWIPWLLNWWGNVQMCHRAVEQSNSNVKGNKGTCISFCPVTWKHLLQENNRKGKEHLFGSCSACVTQSDCGYFHLILKNLYPIIFLSIGRRAYSFIDFLFQ